MGPSTWMDGIDLAVTVCDREGIVLYMNDQSARTFAANGGMGMVGKNLLDCHPPAAREKILRIMKTGISNCYMIEKNGEKKLIYQTPWYEKKELRGLVEFSIVIPFDLPLFKRD